MRTLRIRATGGPVSPLSLCRLRLVFAWPRGRLQTAGNAATPVQGFEVDVDDEPSAARLRRYLDLESRLTGIRLEILD